MLNPVLTNRLIRTILGYFLTAHSFKSMAEDYSTKKISPKLVEELINSLKNIRGWGTVEICIQDFMVTQITEKNIKKPIISVKKQAIKQSIDN